MKQILKKLIFCLKYKKVTTPDNECNGCVFFIECTDRFECAIFNDANNNCFKVTYLKRNYKKVFYKLLANILLFSYPTYLIIKFSIKFGFVGFATMLVFIIIIFGFVNILVYLHNYLIKLANKK